jgi:hypothetical protein
MARRHSQQDRRRALAVVGTIVDHCQSCSYEPLVVTVAWDFALIALSCLLLTEKMVSLMLRFHIAIVVYLIPTFDLTPLP